jgi:hypothetical protein
VPSDNGDAVVAVAVPKINKHGLVEELGVELIAEGMVAQAAEQEPAVAEEDVAADEYIVEPAMKDLVEPTEKIPVKTDADEPIVEGTVVDGPAGDRQQPVQEPVEEDVITEVAEATVVEAVEPIDVAEAVVEDEIVDEGIFLIR